MLETLARLGYASKAVIYAIVGVLAVLTVANRGGAITDTTGALYVVLTKPFGRGLLLILAVGLCGYGAWRLLDKVDWSPIPPDTRTAIRRVSRFGVATRGGLLITLGLFLVRAGVTHDPNQAAGARESLLRLGGLFDGRWFLAVVAVGVMAYAVDQAVHAACRRIRPVA